jgi:hypothetical protein
VLRVGGRLLALGRATVLVLARHGGWFVCG